MSGKFSLEYLVLPFIVGYAIVQHRFSTLNLRYYLLVLLLATIGFLFDSFLSFFGILDFHLSQLDNALGLSVYIAPIWLFALWFWFAITLSHCYQWLNDYPKLAPFLGGVFGPLAYWGASALGVVNIPSAVIFTVTSLLFWFFFFYVTFKKSWINHQLFRCN